MNLFRIFSFLIALLLFYSVAHADPCENIRGHWQGTWTDYHKTYHCTWQLDMTAQKKPNDVKFKYDLSHPNHSRILCNKGDNWDTLGSCNEKGELWFPDERYHGFVVDNHIYLSSQDGRTIIDLNRVST